MRGDVTSGIHMTSLDELLGVTEVSVGNAVVESVGEDKVVQLPLNLLHEFSGHPFRVLEDVKMAETVESISKFGVLVPGIARPHKEFSGEYEIIAGHRRCHASQLAGLSDMPFIVKDLSDEEATVIMVDSNIQREDLLPSEKAKAYSMKYEALKKLGNSAIKGRNDARLAKEAGESRNTIQRYIRLTFLHSDLLKMVDEGRLPKNTAADISYLRMSEQKRLIQIMLEQKYTPSGEQAAKLKEYSKNGTLNETVMRMMAERKEDAGKVSLKGKEIRKYFPATYTRKQIEEVIYTLLKEWQEKEKNTL